MRLLNFVLVLALRLIMGRQRCSWEQLEKHAKVCKALRCGCMAYLHGFADWSLRLPITPQADAGTWLWHAIDDDDTFHWSCIVCGISTRENVACKISNLLRHQQTRRHRERVARLLDMETLDDADFCAAPELQLFEEIYSEFYAGVAPGDEGYNLPSGYVGKEKAHRMLWALDEGHRIVKRQTVVSSEALQVSRDEAKSRLHVRYRTIDKDWNVHAEYMGTARNFDGSSTGLTEATEQVYKKFCTSYLDAPPDAAVTPVFHAEVYEHMRLITEAIAVDSAENEVVAARDLCRNGSFLPNCKYLLRDGAHSARRVLSRGWAADPVLIVFKTL